MGISSIKKIIEIIDNLSLKAKEIDKKNSINKSFSLRKDIAIFSEALFTTNSDKLVDYLEEVKEKTIELKKLQQTNSDFFHARLSLIEEQISSIHNAINANDAQNKASEARLNVIKSKNFKKVAKKLFKPTQELYKKLSETLEFERRLIVMLNNKQNELSSASPSKSERISNELLTIHQRLGRCRQAISKVEREIELSEKR